MKLWGGLLKLVDQTKIGEVVVSATATVAYDDEKVTVRVKHSNSKLDWTATGSFDGKRCTVINGTQKIEYKGRCSLKAFDPKASRTDRSGDTIRATYDMDATNYTDFYGRELKVKRLEAACNDDTKSVSETIAACTELESLQGASSSAAPRAATASAAVNVPKVPNQELKRVGYHRWMRRIGEKYPSRAIRELKQGTVEVELTVGATGRATNCRIVRSSGHAILDDAACQDAQRYARYSPATDANANPVVAKDVVSIRYQLK